MSNAAPIPITILTGFLGSGKTTLLLSLLPQLPAGYKLCLLKNEFGDVEVDSQLASQGSVAGVKELLNGCICCNLVGQLSEALVNLKDAYKPARIVIETSGSAFPATLAMEVNRIVAQQAPGAFELDGVIQVIDVENWAGYADTSYTAKLQAKYTDLIVLNKHELAEPGREDEVMDRIRDVADETPVVRTDKGWIDKDVIFGVDSALARSFTVESDAERNNGHAHDHSAEVDVLSLKLPSDEMGPGFDGGYVDPTALEKLLTTAPKDAVYRIKGMLRFRLPPPMHPDTPGYHDPPTTPPTGNQWVLNWAFGRWTFTPLRESSVSTTIEAPEGQASPSELEPSAVNGTNGACLNAAAAKMRKGSIEVIVQTSIHTSVEEKVRESRAAAHLCFVLARGEGDRWIRRLKTDKLVRYDRSELDANVLVHKLE
ncbi:CobW/HypB/UreG, nucleotide-binding domain-containing protein [Geopyxis carbonaria]|nr:CobW/HypB/UreG, nucleotide-binding domain-containing protein [Geopyxis carbonaria]